MLVAIIQFDLGKQIDLIEAKEMFIGTVEKYKGMPGLVRKYYFVAEDGKSAGGVYLWETKQHAEEVFNEKWKQMLADRYGSEPRVVYHAVPIELDNTNKAVRVFS